jgi:hypothetical protein
MELAIGCLPAAARNGVEVMKSSLASISLATVLVTGATCAPGQKNTEARSDGFFGPIRSVSTRTEMQKGDWHLQDAKISAALGFYSECEYDLQGDRIKAGENFEGVFWGESIQVVRDEKGNITEKSYKNADGEIVRRYIYGPHRSEEWGYETGRATLRGTWSYDAEGRLNGVRGYDQNGLLIISNDITNYARGRSEEAWTYGPNGAFSGHYVETHDGNTGISTFTTFNEDGATKVASTTMGSKLLSYWQRSSEEERFGSIVFAQPEGKLLNSYSCHPGGACDQMSIYCSDETLYQINRREWRDPGGILKLSFDFDYELDSFGNWSKRTVWIWGPELGDRKLYETDYRTLTYWNK